jgi:hypothetical protein
VIDHGVYAVKLAMAAWAIGWIYSAQSKGKAHRLGQGLALFAVPVFLTGVEMIIDHERPWHYLMTHGSTETLEKAFVGGITMLVFAGIMLTLCLKAVSKPSH